MAAVPVSFNSPFAESADDEIRLMQKLLTATRACTHAISVTPADGADVRTGGAGYLWIGGAGNVSVVTAGGETVTITAVAAGTFLPLAVTRVRATNTTATLILMLY